MNHRRVLVVSELGGDLQPTARALARLEPKLEQALVVARGGTHPSDSLFSDHPRNGEAEASSPEADLLRSQASALAPRAEGAILPELSAEALTELATTTGVDLVVAASRTLQLGGLAAELGVRLELPVLWPSAIDSRTGPVHQVRCAARGRRGRAILGQFLATHASPDWRVAVLSAELAGDPDELTRYLAMMPIPARVEVARPGMAALRGWLTDPPSEDLTVLTRMPVPLLVGFVWASPVLVLPADTEAEPPRPELDVADGVVLGDVLRLRVERVSALGSLGPGGREPLAVVLDDQLLATVTPSDLGELELPAGLARTDSVGLMPSPGDEPWTPGTEPDAIVAILRPTERPLVIFDAEAPDTVLNAVRSRVGAEPGGLEPLGVRLRPTQPIRSVRARLTAVHLPDRVVDARAVLDEGAALDVSEYNDPVRLHRVARVLQRAGFAVRGTFFRSFEELGPPDPESPPIGGNRIEVELDNPTARRWLAEAIERARASVCLQVYMAKDDEVGRQIEGALVAAVERGVAVRVLVDSLHGMHRSLGTENPLLKRLEAHAGVELRAWRPVREASVQDLKRRNHAKLCVVDGQVALVGGRNLSHEYYTGFEEVRLGPSSPWREVPWLDAGCRLQGPAVAAVAQCFLEAWLEAGGSRFDITEPHPAGASPARIIAHRGMRDAVSLEAYLQLIHAARDHVYAVNGFPLMLELQHALLRAVRRGVRVRILSGHLVPTHAGGTFAGPLSQPRAVATDFVHSRLDPLVEAGAEVYLYGVPPQPGWEPSLGAVRPHVHAKVLSVDGLRCTVGSANLDITSAYWETEVVVLAEDPAVAGPLESHIDLLMAGSVRVQADDPAWKAAGLRRTWMRHWPGMLSV